MSDINTGGSGGGGGAGTVTSVIGTANQITSDGSTTTPTLSTPSTFIAPGSIAAVTTVKSGTNGGTAGQVILSGSTSGTATLTAPAVAGTIANAVVLSNALTVQSPTLTVGVAGTSSGSLTLTGSTSGSATFTAPATAGTVLNPVLSSNALALPAGNTTNPSLTNTGATTTGINLQAAQFMSFVTGGAERAIVSNVATIVGLGLSNVTPLGWGSTGSASGAAFDTGLSRDAAGVIDVGNGTQGSKSGKLIATSYSTGTATWTSGTGSPESAVTAPVGSLFTRTDGGANTTLYVKESGAGNTGWIAK